MDMKVGLSLEDYKESTMAIVRGSMSREEEAGCAKKRSCKLQELTGGQGGWRVISKGNRYETNPEMERSRSKSCRTQGQWRSLNSFLQARRPIEGSRRGRGGRF